MSDLTIISTMFEEIKDAVKQILSKLSESKKTDNNTNENNHIDKPDLSEITDRVCQSEELIIHKLEQIEQTNAAPKKVHHRISIDIASSWVFLTIIALSIILLISFFFHYKQRETINNFSDNDLKYRYIKMHHKTDSVSIYKLEDIFEYNRDAKLIKEVRHSVEQYEQDIVDRARRMEQAKLKEQEAKKLHDEASKLKAK